MEHADLSLGVFAKADFDYAALAGAVMLGTNVNESSFYGADVVNNPTDGSTQARSNVLPNGETGGLFVSPQVRRAGQKASNWGKGAQSWANNQWGRMKSWFDNL